MLKIKVDSSLKKSYVHTSAKPPNKQKWNFSPLCNRTKHLNPMKENESTTKIA
jgi:hypothetical protein